MGWAPIQITATSAGLTTASTAYVTGDQLGTEITLTGAGAANAGYGAIIGVELIDYSDILGAVDMFVFYDTTTPASDNAANSWSDADANKNIPGSPIMLPAPIDSANNRSGGATNLWIPYKCGSGHSNLYCDLVTRSGHTFFGAVGDIHLNVHVLQYS